MPGGLMQIASTGDQNVMLTGNPTKSFFKSTYRQYTNFGLQKFRVDFNGSKTLRMSEESTFTFKVPRYADLLMDSYLSINIPHIWSPIMPPSPEDNRGTWAPYDFHWIPNLGAKMISKVSITCGNYTLQEFSGDYLLAAVQRDFGATKTALFNEMIGNVPDLVDPGNANGRVNSYPNAIFRENTPAGSEPSIRGRTLYVPLNAWFGLNSTMAFPLVSLQYNELQIVVTMRPVSELFVIRDVNDELNGFPLVAPNFNRWTDQLFRFLQTPPEGDLGPTAYTDTRTQWNADVHLNCTYCFLSGPERDLFARNEQTYLIRQVHETQFMNVTGPNRVETNSLGMVASWLFYFQRSDANLRNAWSNYGNWPYNHLPVNVEAAPSTGDHLVYRMDASGEVPAYIGPGANPDGSATGIVVAPAYAPVNEREILVSMGILLDGAYRENVQPSGVFNYVEKYVRTSGRAPLGLYCYNFGVHGGIKDTQPAGAINMSQFTHVELEFTTMMPVLDPLAQSLNICDPETGEVVGVNKPTWRIYDYNYNLTLFEERFNMVTFVAGNVGLSYAT